MQVLCENSTAMNAFKHPNGFEQNGAPTNVHGPFDIEQNAHSQDSRGGSFFTYPTYDYNYWFTCNFAHRETVPIGNDFPLS